MEAIIDGGGLGDRTLATMCLAATLLPPPRPAKLCRRHDVALPPPPQPPRCWLDSRRVLKTIRSSTTISSDYLQRPSSSVSAVARSGNSNRPWWKNVEDYIEDPRRHFRLMDSLRNLPQAVRGQLDGPGVGVTRELRDRNVDRNTTESTDLLECDGSVVWNDASDALFYVTMDEMHRPHKLYCRRIFDSDGHWIDAEVQNDELLMAEDDELYNLRIAKSFDGRYLLVRSSSKESSEVHYLDLRHEMGSKGMSLAKNLVCIAKRKHKVLYRVTHCQGYWLVQTNIGGLPNLSLKACRVGEEGMETWRDVVSSYTDAPVPVFDGGHARSLDVSNHIFPLTSI